MNLRFKSIGIENFRSIQKADVDLENQGIVLVKGINEYEDKATSNGSGKSSIFEGIIFSLYEETSAGDKDVANRIINDGYTLNLKFSVDGSDYQIIRQQKSSKTTVALYKNGENISARNKSDTNKLILDIIGINKNIFLDSVFLSQNVSTNLASLSPTARKERLEILTNTDYAINEFKTTLKDVQNLYETNCVNDKLEINKLEGKKESNIQQIYDLDQKIKAIQMEIDRLKQLGDIKEIDNQINQIENVEIVNVSNEINECDLQVQNKEQEIEAIRVSGEDDNNLEKELTNTRQQMLMEWQKIQNDIKTQNMNIQFKENHIKDLEMEINKISNSDVCPTCGRKLEDADEDHIKQAIMELENEILNSRNEIKEIENHIIELNSRSLEVENDGNDITSKIQEVQNRLENKQAEIRNIENQRKEILNSRNMKSQLKESYLRTVNELKAKKEQLLKANTNSLDDFMELKKKIEIEINNIEQEIKSYQMDYEKNNDYVNVAKHSIQLVTKEFRTYLLQNSLQYLNNLLVDYSKQLFSNDKDIIRIIGDDTKLNIQLADAPYESLSGGEKTRVNIALLLAQKSLANMIGNISCNIIILDEILGYCDSFAEENVINLLTQELETLESIYMVSHKEIPIGYDTEIVVVKNKQGLSNLLNR